MRAPLPPYPESSFLQTNGHLTHVRAFGETRARTPLLLLHGYLDSTGAWDLVAESLSVGRRVLLVDLLGHGYTERGRGQVLGVPEVLEQVAAVQEAFGAERIHIGGNSMGALVSALYAMERPERVASVTMVDGGHGGPVERIPLWLIRLLPLPLLVEGARRVSRPLQRSLFEWIFREWVYAGREAPKGVVEGFLAPHRLPGASRATARFVRGYVEYLRSRGARTPPETYASLEKPTLILWGENDRIVPLEAGKRLQRQIPGARLVILPRCGHCPPREVPETFVQALEVFLEGVDLA